MMVDTHCHVYDSEMKDAREIIEEALRSNIHMILNGTGPSSNREVLELAGEYDNVHASLGFLYTFADDVDEGDIDLLDLQLEDENVIAVGEIGLDYYHGKENRDAQIHLFNRMLELAEKHDLPVIVHSRKSIQDTYDMLKSHDVVGSLHCYQGSVEMAREFIKMGFYIGVGGPVTHQNNRKVRRTVSEVGLDRLLLETDSPYLAPEEVRGERNTPLNLKHITAKIADELGIAEDGVIEMTSKNAGELFGFEVF